MSKPIFILAPMDDVTDTVFRRVIAECAAPDMTMTEFVNVDGLCSPGRPRLIRKLDTSLDSAPVIAQIWGKKPENFETIAREISSGDIPGFSGIDINFGCPAKSEIKADCCSALQKLELRPEAEAMIEATLRGASEFPVSFKTRLGFNQIDYTWHEFLLGYKPSMLTVHVRTTKQMSKVPADWGAIKPILELRDKLSPDTKIIMNGDIMDKQHGREIVELYGVDGVMVGRGIFQNPYCFDDNAQEKWAGISKKDRVDHFKRHVLMHEKQWPDNAKPFNPLKKFAKVYISDFSGASDLRAKIMETEVVSEALAVIADHATT
jgi:tRNA-dihydrouridine synthase